MTLTQSEQIHSYIRNRTIPDDAESALRRRNTPVDAKPDAYDAVRAFYTLSRT